jgi:penicillin-binding protein 2
MQEIKGSRINFFRFFSVLIFIIYGTRLFTMQILSGDVYRTRAQDISRRTVMIPTQRGEIFDRNVTQPLVMNRDSFAINITPAEVPRGKMEETLKSVSAITGVPADDLAARIPNQSYQLYQPVEIAYNVPFSVIASLAERKDTLPGISWQSKPVRNYVSSGSIAHIVGYVGDITRDELTSLYNKGYQQGDIIGKSGIEKQYDELLRGKEGIETRTVDVRGRRITEQANNIRTPPVMGKNLVLTIDMKLQALVEKALGERIGTAIVMRPSTGEILAMVSYPWYDQTIFTEGNRAAYQLLLNDPNRPLINRAIMSSYPPASTFKIIMTTAVLAENAFPSESLILCPGMINFGNRDWNCHVRRPGHGRLNLHGGLAQSCDIYYWTIGRDYLGAEKIYTYAKNYGYGDATSIDLPGEIEGFIPTPQWKERRYHEKWVAGDTMNMSIGQGYTLVTPLQMANMVCMVVNSGKVYKPHVLKEIRDPETNAIEKIIQPEILHESKLSAAIFENVRRDMRGVISEGTARYPLNIRSVQIAGKTGTGEVGLQDRWHSWFTAYAPYDSNNNDDKIVLSIIVEAANKWEWWSPYASATIFQGYFANQSYEEAVQALGFQFIMPLEGRRE